MAQRKKPAGERPRRARKPAAAPEAPEAPPPPEPEAAPPPAEPEAPPLPEAARELLARIQELCADVLTSEDPAAADRLAAESGHLERLFGDLRARAEAFARATRERETSLALIRAQIPELPIEPPSEIGTAGGPTEEITEESGRAAMDTGKPEEGIQLDRFMREVAEAIVTAQKRLDLQSLAYARQVRGTPIAPAHFAIPSVRAEVKMGLTMRQGRGLLAHLFGSPEEKSGFSESTVAFEVVSTPPPPGGSGEFAAPVPEFLVVGKEREEVLQRLEGAFAPERLGRAAVLLNPPPELAVADPADFRKYIVLIPGLSNTGRGDVVRLSLDAAPGPEQAESPNAFYAHLIHDLAAELRFWEESVSVAKE